MPTLEDVRKAQKKPAAKKAPAQEQSDAADDLLLDDPVLEVEPEPAGVNQPSGDRVPVTRSALGDQEDWFNICYYGDGGTGKTTDLAAMAHLGKVIMINAESGIKGRALQRRGIPLENIEVVPDPVSGQDLSFQLLDDLFWELKSDLESGRSAYIGVSWDSISEIVKKILTNVIHARVRRNIKSGKTGVATDPFFTDISDYGEMSERLRLLIRRYRDLPIHFGMSALERRDVDDDGKVLYRPAMTPALHSDVYGYSDMVCHCEVIEDPDGGDDDIYMGLFRPVGKYRAKDRLGAMPIRLVSPTFDRVVAYNLDDLTVETDTVQIAARERLYSKTPGDEDE